MFGQTWRIYHQILNKYPLRTQMVQTGLIMGLGDLVSQRVIHEKSDIDPISVIRFSGIGTFFVGPSVRLWYLFMERVIGSAVNKKTTFIKVGMDQLLFAPTFTAGIMIVINPLQAKSFDEIKKELRSKYTDVMLNGWKIWPMAQVVNFYFIPFLYRPLFVNIVALFWNTYLAWKIN
uniref:Mitochondrial inner membrane protein Mpv17 n=1 Tax=Lepeophtheirus salmonis TaxID=72036 RepID=C1BTV5_LEPSM|nr:Mpv17 [Lepeophtheirus salmonis]